jgi:hypothetical protein
VQRVAKRLLVTRCCFPQSFDPSIKDSATIHRLGSARFCQCSVIFGKKPQRDCMQHEYKFIISHLHDDLPRISATTPMQDRCFPRYPSEY